MVRTVLRSRADDLVSAVQLADRTGIVAASAPPSAEPDEHTEPAPPVLFATPEPPAQRRRGRRNVLFGCAAALFLLVGWIGGGTFGHHDPAPAVASAPMADQVRPDAPPDASGPPSTSAPVQPPAAAPAPAAPKTVTSTKRVTVKQAATPATSESEPVQPRDDQVGVEIRQDPVTTVDERFQQMLTYWAWVNEQTRGNGYVRGFGSGH